ncbi:MAG: EamA family transporter [Campylobacteraceae bacterium]|nr:EamA family transporter [Campylobacteraceae bacterium]
MKKLILVTLIWAFSFSLIGECLRGVNGYYAAFLRVFIALLCFLPFMKLKGMGLENKKLAFITAIIGAFQIGLMYIFYYNSFRYLSVPEVALFTIFTPFYVTIFYDILRKRVRALYLISVGLAVFGAFVIKFGNINPGFLTGFLLVQGANICFGIGQSSYKFILEKYEFKEQFSNFGFFFVGAVVVCLLGLMFYGERTPLSLTQVLVVLWLGVGASGAGYFLWNKGACEVDSGVLAIMNNALIPVAILVNLVFWKTEVDFTRFIIGGLIIALSLVVHKRIIKHYELKSYA